MGSPTLSDILSKASDDRPDLSNADPCHFRDYDRWFRFMVRCFHSGVTREEFIAWCVAIQPTAETRRASGGIGTA
jgi:hypothetical protein